MNEKDRKPRIHKTAQVADTVELGDWSVVGANTRISGKVKIGRAAYITDNVTIGGGQHELGSLEAGDFLGLWDRVFVNTAARVTIGNEVGLGMDSKIFTHGNYLSELDGFPFQRGPVSIGDKVWLPYAIVLPNVKIGDNVVVSAMSLVIGDLPSGCLAGGMPARIIERDRYPKRVRPYSTESILEGVANDANYYGIKELRLIRYYQLRVGRTEFFPLSHKIKGPANKETEIVRNLFRRRGVRFRYYDNKGVYQEWD